LRSQVATSRSSSFEVETKILNKAVKRNAARFPNDFMFQVTAGELENLRFQFGTSSSNLPDPGYMHGGRRYLPYVFTEQGVAMLSDTTSSSRSSSTHSES
jgi:hypothetical protein